MPVQHHWSFGVLKSATDPASGTGERLTRATPESCSRTLDDGLFHGSFMIVVVILLSLTTVLGVKVGRHSDIL